MAPPAFADLGKQARDVFSKNFHFGKVKFDCKSQTQNKVEFNVSGVSDNDNGCVSANFETKYFLKDRNCLLKQKWTTQNNLISEVQFDDYFAKGSRFILNTNLEPQSGKKSFALKSSMKGDYFNANTNFDFDPLKNGAKVNSALVLGQNGWLTGARIAFSPQLGKIEQTDFSVGYLGSDFHIHTNVTDGKKYSGSVFHKVSPDLDVAINIAFESAETASNLGIGCLYRMDPDTHLKANVNNKNKIGLALIRKLNPGITVSLCAMIDGKNFNHGGHRIGMGIDICA
uniref:Voltage-dependent anion-selective channel n=1 Tax=Sarcoptes scabiei TaxID=52283 RepID=A0A834R386_SARSC